MDNKDEKITEEVEANEQQLLEAMTKQDMSEYKAVAGNILKDGTPVSSLDKIVETIRNVYDPEIPINVYDMGLIYGIHQQENGDVLIDMTLTAPGCPVAGVLPQEVADKVSALEGVGRVEVKIVWEPQWTIERMTEEGRAIFDLF